MRILIVEDNTVLADGLTTVLIQNGYDVEHFSTKVDSLLALKTLPFDLLILDLGLPDGDGLEVLTSVRNDHNPIPVLILTARDSVEDRVKGLNQGADDYLGKPFKVQELEARVNALIRRHHYQHQEKYKLGALCFAPASKEVRVNNIPISLSHGELTLLDLLIRSRGALVSKETLIEALCSWDDTLTSNAIEALVSRLRKKIHAGHVTIQAVWGRGYMLKESRENND